MSFHLDPKIFLNVSSFYVAIYNHNQAPRGYNMFPAYVSRRSSKFITTTDFNRSLAGNITDLSGGISNNSSEPKFIIDKTIQGNQLFSNKFSFSFSIYHNTFQRPPYAPNCYDYNSKSLFRSRDHCKDSCLAINIADMSDKVPASDLIFFSAIKSAQIDGNKSTTSPLDYFNRTLILWMRSRRKSS